MMREQGLKDEELGLKDEELGLKHEGARFDR